MIHNRLIRKQWHNAGRSTSEVRRGVLTLSSANDCDEARRSEAHAEGASSAEKRCAC